MTIATLQERIYNAADAKLRERIETVLGPIRAQVANMKPVEFVATEVLQTAQTTRVVMLPDELLDVLAAAAFEGRQDNARLSLVNEFLKKVKDAGIQI